MAFSIGQRVSVKFKQGGNEIDRVGLVEGFYDGKINVRFADKSLFTLPPDKVKDAPVPVAKEEKEPEKKDS